MILIQRQDLKRDPIPSALTRSLHLVYTSLAISASINAIPVRNVPASAKLSFIQSFPTRPSLVLCRQGTGPWDGVQGTRLAPFLHRNDEPKIFHTGLVGQCLHFCFLAGSLPLIPLHVHVLGNLSDFMRRELSVKAAGWGDISRRKGLSSWS